MSRVQCGIARNAFSRDCLLEFASSWRAACSAIVLGDRAFAWDAEPMMVFESRRVDSFRQQETEAEEITTKHTKSTKEWREGWNSTSYSDA